VVAVSWKNNAEGKVLHQMWSPSGKSYREKRTVALGARVASATVAGLAVDFLQS